ncbi:hypothetical protein [Streptomyces sp. NBC_00996]|uniref:hypothetical protein n=1 Tax=Streptomyces sp. NBC_00996 TaxID=2903710 RepID=UPI003865C576|nr:hypothetical protein OG390_35775 [Streptomyces sp. NBC_00996]
MTGGATRRQGTYTTPTGTYTITEGFGMEAGGTAMPYHRVTDDDWWVEDPESKFYNSMHGEQGADFQHGRGHGQCPAARIAGSAARGEVTAMPLTGGASRTEVTTTWLRRSELRPSVPAFLATARSAFEELASGQAS